MHGIQAIPLNSDANIESTGLMTFPPYTEHGDSGAPVFRFANNRFEVVGLVGGLDEANDQFEIEQGANAHTVTYATTFDYDRLQLLDNAASDWASRQRSANSGSVPQPDTPYPNGAANDTQATGGAAGPATPVTGNLYTGQNGYFTHFYPMRDPVRIAQPGPAGGSCQ